MLAASGQPRASYTQWEYLLAKHFGKQTYVFFTDSTYAPDKPNDEPAERRACQTAYRDWIQHTGEHWSPLSNTARLIEDVTVLPWPTVMRRRPKHLPYTSLGTLFKGRDSFIADLRDSLKRAVAGRAAAIVGKAVHGLGGVGKTRLAVEYAWQHADDYNALLFVVGSSASDLRRAVAELADLADLKTVSWLFSQPPV